MSILENKPTKLVHFYHDNCYLYDGLNIVQRTFDNLINEEIDILVDVKIPDANIWSADIEVILFRVKSNGWLGYKQLIPAGYSSYTYEPEECTHLYQTTDFEWFFKYALTDDIRGYSKVAEFIADTLMHKVLTE